jgi:hypothetical protein
MKDLDNSARDLYRTAIAIERIKASYGESKYSAEEIEREWRRINKGEV